MTLLCPPSSDTVQTLTFASDTEKKLSHTAKPSRIALGTQTTLPWQPICWYQRKNLAHLSDLFTHQAHEMQAFARHFLVSPN